MYQEETWLSGNWESLGFLYVWKGSGSWHVHTPKHTYAHTWNHVPSLWFEFTTCRQTHMQMWRLGSDTHALTVHEHSPTWHMCTSSSWHWLVCIEAHWENPIQFSWIQFNSVQSSKCWLSTYYMPWITWHWEYWIFFKGWNLRSQFRGGGSLAN